jgi:hypothetical protein
MAKSNGLPTELLARLEKYSELPLECDGMTRVVTYLLTQEGISHSVKAGTFFHRGERVVPLHYWVELPDGKTIDYKARMWAGESAEVPHGVFDPKKFPKVKYSGVPTELIVSNFVFKVLTDRVSVKE